MEDKILTQIKMPIPTIDDKRLLDLYKRLKPIVTIEELKYLLREFSLEELRNTSYIWNIVNDKRETVDASKLETIQEFPCLHTYGYYGFFKPSIAEVLSQVPEKTIEEANYFEIVSSPKTREDVFRYSEIVNNGYHLSKVRSYKLHK